MVSDFEREIAFQSLRGSFDRKACDLLRAAAIPGLVRLLRKQGYCRRKNEDPHQLALDSFNLTIAMSNRFGAWRQCFAYMAKVARSRAIKRMRRRTREVALPEGFQVRDPGSERFFEGIDLAQAIHGLGLKERDLQLLEAMLDTNETDRVVASRMRISINTLRRRRSELKKRLRKHLNAYRPEP